MKKTLFKSLLLGFAALTALNASAENKVYIDDFTIEPGATTDYIKIMMDNDDPVGAWQLFMTLPEGLSVADAQFPGKNERKNRYPYTYIEEDDEYAFEHTFQADYYGESTDVYAIVVLNMKGHNMLGNSGAIFRMKFTAAEDFKGGDIQLTYFKSDYWMVEGTAEMGNWELNNPDVCHVSVPVTATPLKEIVETGVNGTEYTVKEDLAIVAKSDKGGYLFVSDGAGNWMKVKAESAVYDAMKGYESIKGGTLIGVLSDANCNQTLTITKAAEEAGIVTASAVAWNLGSTTTKFAPKVNEVILLTGYWFNDEGAFRGYSGNNGGKKGQSATADFSWCDTDATMTNGAKYVDIQSVAQLKEPWGAATTGAPAKVAADDPLSFQNYIVYPLAISESQVITGVDNLNASKDVVSVQYVNAAGMVSTTPFKGVNMVVTRYADGSQVTTKVVK